MLLVLPAAAAGPLPGAPNPLRTPSFLTIPESEVLRHGQMRLLGDFQQYNRSEIDPGADTVESSAFNYMADLTFGFENRAEISFQFGEEFSMGLKTLLIEEDVYFPDLVFGIRNLFSSQEAGLYGLSGAAARSLRGESYFGAAKQISPKTRLHLGASLLNGGNKSLVGFYGGLEADLGAGAVAVYEIFERFSDFHQLVGLSWRYGRLFTVTVALTEFQSWVRQNGEWGFFLAPTKPEATGYNSPGIRFSLSAFAFMPRVERKTVPERVVELEKKNQEQARELEGLKGRLATLRLEQDAARRALHRLAAGGQSAPLEGPEADFQLLAELYKTDAEPSALRTQVEKVLSHGEKARPVLEKAALNAGAPEETRVSALLAVAASQDTAYGPLLVRLCRDRNPRMRREAITALARVMPKAMESAVKPLLKDPDEAVAMTARAALQELGAPPKNQ